MEFAFCSYSANWNCMSWNLNADNKLGT